MNQLQTALTKNFIFSSLSGLVLIILQKPMTGIFGLESPTVFWVIGLVLLYFALTIIYERRKQRRWAVIWICIQDFLWVLGSILLLIMKPFGITLAGNMLIGIIAAAVLYLGIIQLMALSRQRVSI